MATNAKTGDTPKDTQIKPIVQSSEQVIEQTADPPENSLYHTEDKALLDPKNELAQASLHPSVVSEKAKKIDKANEVTARGEEKKDRLEKIRLKSQLEQEVD